MIDLKKALSVAEEAVTTAGKFLLAHQRDVVIKKHKDAVDIQTDADLKAEEICIKTIQASFPNHNILSEEIGFIDHQSDFTWVIDPLDGTKEYIRQIPLWGTILSLETKLKTLVAACYFPPTNELYSASSNQATLFNHQPVKLSSEKKITKSFIYTHPPTSKTKKQTANFIWDKLKQISFQAYRLRAHANDAWVLSWLSRGGLEGYWLPDGHLTEWYDISPGLLIAKQAEAKITDSYGKPVKRGDLTKGIVITNDHIHDQLLNIINLQGQSLQVDK
ncbi:MAG: inositol monophosphatase [Candidatus Beckwithbacteria bacterium]|nr:inositol monophosphatase [Patescibacteria group bacterium]